MSRQLNDDAVLYFETEDNDVFFIDNIVEEDDKLCLYLGGKPTYEIDDLLNDLEDIEQTSKHVYAIDINNTYYDIERNLYVDEDGNACMAIIKDKESVFDFETTQKYQSDFSEDLQEEGDFNKRIKKLAKKMGAKMVYITYWLYYSLKNGGVKAKTLGIITGALGYLLCPLDVISDLIPFIGFSDDITILTAAYFAVMKTMSPDTIKRVSDKAKKAVKSIFGDVSDDDIKI